MLGVYFPLFDIVEGLPIGYGNSFTVGASNALDSNEAFLFFGQFHHFLGHDFIAIVIGRFLRRENHCVIGIVHTAMRQLQILSYAFVQLAKDQS